jgi:ABC-type multidrug transport system ATPase subunit
MLLQVQKLQKWFGDNKAVKKISFDIRPGEVVGLFGPNGAGKSTTIKSICGLLRKTSGNVFIDGHPNDSIAAKKILSYAPEVPELYNLLSVTEHLEFISQAYDLKDWKPLAEELLTRFDLVDKRDKLGKELSKGMKQKVSISCALLSKPKLLLMDEPMIGLDPKAIRECKKIITETAENGAGVLISTHLLDSVEQICSRIVIMKNGEIIGNDTLPNLKRQFNFDESKSLEELFLDITNNE